MSKIANEIRFYGFISGVLRQQQTDPICRECKAFGNTAVRMKEAMAQLEAGLAGQTGTVSPEILSLLAAARVRLDSIKIAEGAVGQKKAGRCKMPEGICLVKLSKALQERM
jgi:hypothetical protein